jgi:hypothetical protein
MAPFKASCQESSPERAAISAWVRPSSAPQRASSPPKWGLGPQPRPQDTIGEGGAHLGVVDKGDGHSGLAHARQAVQGCQPWGPIPDQVGFDQGEQVIAAHQVSGLGERQRDGWVEERRQVFFIALIGQ